MRFRLAHALGLGFGAIFVFALLTSLEWPTETRLFTLTIATAGLLLALLGLAAETKRAPQPPDSRSLDADYQAPSVQPGIGTGDLRWRAITIFAWIFALVLLIRMVNFKIAIPLFTFLYLRLQVREGLLVCFLLTALMILLIIGLFDFVLHVPWPKGLIEGWLKF